MGASKKPTNDGGWAGAWAGCFLSLAVRGFGPHDLAQVSHTGNADHLIRLLVSGFTLAFVVIGWVLGWLLVYASRPRLWVAPKSKT